MGLKHFLQTAVVIVFCQQWGSLLNDMGQPFSALQAKKIYFILGLYFRLMCVIQSLMHR